MTIFTRVMPKTTATLSNFGRLASLRADCAFWVHADWSTMKNATRCTTNKSSARSSDEVSDDYFVHSALRWETKLGADSFFVANIRALKQRHKLWTEAMPNVQPFYAVKSNPDQKLMSVLHSLGCGFDCASQDEIDRALAVGVHPDSIIFANPCKQEKHILHAKHRNVKATTFDSAEELHKIAELYPESKCILRLAVDDSNAYFKFSDKFGAALDDVPSLLAEAKALGLDVRGLSFHVGSANEGADAHSDGVAQAYEAFKMGQSVGYDMGMLDLGGGWPGHAGSDDLFREMAGRVQTQIRKFPDHVQFVAEPGRFFAESYMSLATQVHSRARVRGHGDGVKAYHIGEGVSGVLQDALCDPGCFDSKVVKLNSAMRDFDDQVDSANKQPLVPTKILGPTDHPLDCVVRQKDLPEICIGDWLIFKHVGAYTSVFDDNGPATVYVSQ